MGVEWYYQSEESTHGPVSGKQLRSLADSGTVVPPTPVRRVVGDNRSPWTRAGAIRELFEGDVRDQLGDPICDDCGALRADGTCPKCDPRFDPGEVSSAPEPPPVADVGSQTSSAERLPAAPSVVMPVKDFRTTAILFVVTAMLALMLWQRPTSKQWEYMIANPPDNSFDERMDGYGREGWELVTARRATSEYSDPSYECIFKRAR